MNNNLYNTSNITESDRILHTPSEFARKNLLYIQEVGQLKSLIPHVSSRSELDSYLFFVVLKGSGTVTINERQYHIRENEAVFINCMDEYEHISDENNPWELVWVHFNGVNVSAYYDMFLQKNNQSAVCALNTVHKLVDIIQLIRATQDDKDVMCELNTSLHLTMLMTQLIQDVNEQICNKGQNIVTKLREIINERFKEENLFEHLCQEYGFDEIEINKEYKNRYGIDLCDYILNRRFTFAKELLRFSVKPVKDIVKESGIGNADLFRHLFIENEGMTAEEYRKKWSQWNRG